MKKLLSLILVLTMLFALCACGKTESPAEPSAPAAEEDSISTQLVSIFNSICMLKTNSAYEKYWYCITDLDHNGRLEVTGAVTEGSGSNTSAMMYQIGSDLKSLEPVDLRLAEGEYLPELIKGQVETYFSDADKTWNYIFFDTAGVGTSSHFQTMYSVCLNNGVLSRVPLGYQNVTMDGENTKYVFTDAAGATLSGSDEYVALASKHFGKIGATTNLDWFSLRDIYSTDRLAKSYGVFAGTEIGGVDPVITPIPIYSQAPTVTATPAPSASPSPSPTPVPAPVVTKNPTAETLFAGGTCQFVAKADNSSSMRWKLVSPNGDVYDAASSPFAGRLVVSGINSTCLTLSSVPLEMNGYSAYAEFYGTTTVQSSRAKITVKQAEKATVSSSVRTGYVFCNLWNTVTLYSSDGSDIYYECIKSGDSGPYESGTVKNGGSINIVGIEGTYVNVEVYANAKGSDKVSYYSYGVERTPAPPYEYTEYGTVVGDNFAEIFIRTDSGTHYIEKAICMFGGTGYPDIGDYAEVTFRNGQPLIAFIDCTGVYFDGDYFEAESDY